jgi:hypothetical protein
MALYHFVDKNTKLVVYADKIDGDELATVRAANESFNVVKSKTGKPNAPAVFPGFLYHNDEFWAPMRQSSQVTTQTAAVGRDEFLRLFTFDELADIFSAEDDKDIDTKQRKKIRAFLRYVSILQTVPLADAMVMAGIVLLRDAGVIAPDRVNEVFLGVAKQ